MIDSATQSALTKLRSSEEIRLRCGELLAIGERGDLAHFDVCTDRLDAVAQKVANVTRSRYADLKVPIHSRWRHFEVSGINRWNMLVCNISPLERARIALDVVVPSVLLDAGAGHKWKYQETQTGLNFSRSEGLAIATFEMFTQGAFSANPNQPLRTDATILKTFSTEKLEHYMQVRSNNLLPGLEGRAHLLRSLGDVLCERKELFGESPRMGNLINYFIETMPNPNAQFVLELLLDLLSSIWPERIMLNDTNLGDVWRHSAIRRTDETDMLVPFHKLTQWLTYSLIEPLKEAGIVLKNPESLTGLAEYRNGGLFLDLDVLVPRDTDAYKNHYQQNDELVVEWRALTLALLEKLVPLVHRELGCSESELPLAAILEGGTWATGRLVATENRPSGDPPIKVISNGTLF